MFRFPYMTLTQLGQLFGVSSHQIGKWLVRSAFEPTKTGPAGKRSWGIT